MLREIDNFFLQKEEPVKSCLQALRTLILTYDAHVTEVWSYKLPFYYHKGKRCCYVSVHKKTGLPYVGIVNGNKIEHPKLIIENRARMKIMLIDPNKDIPVKTVRSILKMAVEVGS